MEIWRNGLAVSCMVFKQKKTVILCKQKNKIKDKQSFMYMEVLNKC